MNLVGKIITVTLFLMSLVFLGLAVLTFATSQNYKELIAGVDGAPALDTRLRDARTKLDASEAKLEQLKLRLAHEQGSRRAALAALETKSIQLSMNLKSKQKQFATLITQHQENITQIGTAQSEIRDLKAQVDQARSQLDSDFEQRDEVLKAITATTDKLNQGEGQLRRLKERSEQLRRRN